MTDQDNAAIFGLDDSNVGVEPSFLENQDSGSVTSPTNDLPQGHSQRLTEEAPRSAVSGDTTSYYNPNSGWGYQGTPPYQPYDGVTTTAPTEAIFQTSPWDLSPQQADGLPPFSQPPNVTPSAIYADSMTSRPAPNAKLGQSPTQSLADDPTNVLSLSSEALSALTPTQREKLRNIAMPPHLQYHSPKSDAAVSPSGLRLGDVSSPENLDAPKLSSRKRKSSADVDDEEEDDEDGDETQPVKKTAHNMIEKRYRTNLNDKIAALRDSVPSLRIMSKSARGEDTTEDREELHGLTPAHKLNKATVLSKATEYIRHLEKRNVRLQDENSSMLQRISAFEKLFMAGAMNGTMNALPQPPTPMQFTGQEGQRYINPSMGTPPGGESSPAGMIQVPDDMKRILQAQMAAGQPYPVPQQSYQSNPTLVRQQQIQQQQQMQTSRWRNNAPYYGKLMVGSLAGLMILEAVREEEQSPETPEGRGLLGVPLHLLGSVASSMNVNVLGYHFSASQVIWSMKLVAVLGLVLWLYVPSIFAPSEKKAKSAEQVRTSLQAASLASPIHVRRQAWLTAIQTVWVPQHNFFLEAAALMLKTLKLSLRNTIGMHGYQMLTGLTEEQEAARVKAWAIALDAQLAGGDVEINRPRLTLTLLASGTLPSTPLRLMLKALHVRVLLWELCSNPMQLGLVNIVAAKLARAMWNEARQLHHMKNRLGEASSDELPDHLALLLEQNCDDVLNDSVIQRAHNLAWNLSTTHKATQGTEGMDAVIEDGAVRSPLDAVAAWWSSQMVQQALVESLENLESLKPRHGQIETERAISTKLGLAIEAAPIGSVVQARAMVARAFLVSEKRGRNIAAAVQAVGPVDSGAHLPPSPVPSDPEIKAALQCAMAMAHLQRGSAASQQTLRIIAMIASPSTMANMSLLGYTAASKLMEHLFARQALNPSYGPALERLAGSLRIWIGGTQGDESSLDQTVRHKMVDRCLTITKSVVGMENDPGYGSMSECEESNEC